MNWKPGAASALVSADATDRSRPATEQNGNEIFGCPAQGTLRDSFDG